MPRTAGGGRGGGNGGRGSRSGRGRNLPVGGRGVCYEFQRTGTCKFGARCRFRHGPGGLPAGSHRVPPVVPRSSGTNVQDFIRHLSMAGNRLSAEMEASPDLWYQCFLSHKSLPKNARTLLLQVLATTPPSCSIDPPDLSCCENIVEDYLRESCSADDLTLTAVKTVHDVVNRLLQFTWDVRRETVQEIVSNMIEMSEAKLKKRLSDHRNLSKSLMLLMEELEKSWRIKVRFPDEPAFSESVPTEELTFADWKHADIRWVCNPKFFAPSRCPKMLVGANGVYNSAEEYMDTVLQLWVAMTFADGHAALAPHCRSRGNNGMACGNALWPVSSAAANMRCRTRGCPFPVEYSCRIKSHDSLCLECSAECVRQHCEGPGKAASTHVYDAEVHQCNEEGIVFIKNFKSRNPPPNVHWRTTKRLSPPNLVGLVVLKRRHATLEPSDRVIWGEIVYHGDARDEERRRQNGQLAVNVWSLQDNVDLDLLAEDSTLAVVDCMSFVPEWVPVLKALEIQRNARLPLENGKYLNLVKDDPVELISVVNETSSPRHVFSENREPVIQRVLDASLLEPIREIRRDDTLRQELVQKLSQLVDETTLDIQQFVSFLDALSNPLHLTQGPPGTGKSYLGVVLVRALMIIRSLWLRKSRSTSSPPILVLSYKNMAINHFLIDLVEKEPRNLSSSNLIRIGSNTKDMDPRLIPFSERSIYQHDVEVKRKRTVVEKLTSLRNSIENVIVGGMSSFLSFQERMHSAVEAQERRMAANTFTEFIMACVVRLHVFQKLSNEATDESNEPNTVMKELSFLELEPTTLKPCDKLMHLIASPSECLLPMMDDASEGVQHYHWGDLLLMWLQGRRPLPPCIFSGCFNKAICQEVLLCDDHRCHSGNNRSDRCRTASTGRRSCFCVKHQCSLSKCMLEKLSADQEYCKIHACRRCLELGVPAKLARGTPPMNVCSDHSLCSFPRCIEYCVSGEMCCQTHLHPRCLATTRKGKPCKGTPVSRFLPYCPDHKQLPPPPSFQTTESSDDSESSDDEQQPEQEGPLDKGEMSHKKRCSARTRMGRECKSTVLPGTIFCYVHQLPEQEPFIQALQKSRLDSASARQPKIPPSDVTIPIQGNESHALLYEDTDPMIAPPAIDAIENSGVSQEDEEMDIEGENLQHLRDVFEAPSASDSDDDEFLDADDFGSSEEVLSSTVIDISPDKWTWLMSSDERRQACLSLVDNVRRHMFEASNRVKKAHLQARKDLQQAKVRAKTRVYENKSIIGGTMVGCISRLESIRATRPFAIVVEEASEVLEPLLFSCLTESTVKLEMIGDHRQLQPSVMSRFDYEIMCNVNVSMFQRLIESPQGHALPSTVLSVQRRMRRDIADLTRDFYKDVVEIEDHVSCCTQLVGQRNAGKSSSLVHTTSTQGREVPGIGPHVFLWTHGGAQGRAHVGISRINQTEAEMVCALGAYLVQCGVPRSSIAILTPYKGQLMLIRNLLQKDKRFTSASLLPTDRSSSETCRVSTVDRFQGDEEDIIIVSLVVDENSKTGFVKLVNRMIVLLSRARLGCYLLGNQGFMGNNNSIPKHWLKTLGLLERIGTDDATAGLVKPQDLYVGSRIGAELPLCCPIHRGNTKQVASAANLRLGFCVETCSAVLTCGHTCPLHCHWPSSSHVAKCDMKLESPCPRHPKPVLCHAAFNNAVGHPYKTSFGQILQFYQCPIKVVLRLHCEHEVQIPCWEDRQVVDGIRAYPICRRPSTTPFTFIGCGHSLNVSCEELARYTEDPSLVQCQETVQYEPDCGHVVQMKCFQRKLVLEGVRSHECETRLPIVLPRCGHDVKSIKCAMARKICNWTGQSCVEIGTLVEGTPYGPQDYLCRKTAKIIRSCGHHLELSCAEAFARSETLPSCQERVDTRNPDCGHHCRIPCTHAAVMQSLDAPEPLVEWSEGQVQLNKATNLPVPSCKQTITLVRRCGHSESIPCSNKELPVHPCKTIIEQQSPVCGHFLKVACTFGDAFKHSVWPEDTFKEIVSHSRICSSLVIKHLCKPETTTGILLQQSKLCKEMLMVQLGCGHSKAIACSELGDFASGFYPDLSACSQETKLRLDCGHCTTAACHAAETFKSGASSTVVCTAMKRRRCWNFSNCGQILRVKCTIREDIACDALSRWQCPAGLHRYDLPVCSKGEPSWCPGCTSDNLLNAPSTILHPPEIMAIESAVPHSCIENLHGDETAFFEREKKMIRKQIAAKPFEQTRNHIHRIPCFRLLQGENVGAHDFNPLKFVSKKSSFGIITKTFTKTNLEEIAAKIQDDNDHTVLIGYATVARVNDATEHELPRKEQRAAMTAAFHSQDFDAMLYSEKGMESLVVWDPFPMIAVYRIVLSKERFLQLADFASDWKKPSFTAEKISMIPPPKEVHCFASITSAENPPSCSDSESEVSDSEIQGKEFDKILAGTILENLPFDLAWVGGISFHEKIPPANESDMLNKMQFVNYKAKPFAALNRLKALVQKYPNCALLNLLMAAEYTLHSQEKGKEHLQQYLDAIKDDLLHPWTLVVFARLFVDSKCNALQLYAASFPNQTEILAAEELELIRTGEVQNQGNAVTWHDQLCGDWAKIQRDNPRKTVSPSTDALVKLTGLRKVKELVLKLWKSALQLSRMKHPETRKKNSFVCNYIFVGTGKTTVARLLANILNDCGLRPERSIVETTAQLVKDGGTDEFRKKVSGALGGCFFIDEAYDLDPMNDLSGKPIVNELLTLSEDRRDEISFILAGYEDEFENKFFAYNDGLRSRFKIMPFEDFDEQELATIWNRMRETKEWVEEQDVCRVVVRRMVKLAGKKGFGNAREVRRRLEEATQSAMSRLGDELDDSTMKLTIEDVIGQDPRLQNEKLKRLVDEIEEKIGWRKVKDQIKGLLELCGVNYRRELLGLTQLDVFLNRLFLGNPGTGKTTCAKLYGKLLKELGFLSNGDVVSKTASDFVGQYIGQSQTKTSQILESAKGKVLIIDECYALDDNSYGKQVLDTIVEKVHGGPAEDISVLLLGYEEQMLKMISNQNPGLNRRFPKEQAFYFDDYDDNELLRIMDLNFKKNEVSVTIEFREKLLEVLQTQRKQTNFGNAGAVELIIKAAMLKAAKRDNNNTKTMILEDIDIDSPGSARANKNADPMVMLDSLFKMEKVKAKLEKMRKTWAVAKHDGDDHPKLGHFVFTGSPGTGKTTVARAIASVLYSLGLMPSDKIVETSALELTAGYVGQTKDKVNAALKEAKGGVLFIDEAYNLGVGHFGKEACDTIVAAMTSETYCDVVIVIAGYPNEIDDMLKTNAGLKSRFNHFFDFPDWDSNDCVCFLQMLANREKFEIEDLIFDDFEASCEELRMLDGWGNGRDVTKLWEMAKSNRGERVFNSGETRRIVSMEDIIGATNEMLASRQSRERTTPSVNAAGGDPPAATESDTAVRPRVNPHTVTQEATQINPDEEESEIESTISQVTNDDQEASENDDDDQEASKNDDDDFGRDSGVPDSVWKELSRAKRRQNGQQAALALKEAAYQQFLLEQQRREETAQRLHEESLERIRRDAEKLEQQQLIQKALEAEQQRQHEEELERRRREIELRQQKEEERKRNETISRLQIIGRCPMGFEWFKHGGGWRCDGGSHFVSDAELRQLFGKDA